MNHSGDAAEQIVRMSLEGVEVAARLTGTAAKEMALLLLAALKNNSKDSLKLKGKARLTSMLKSGKPLEIFSVKDSDLKQFMQGAKQYGIVYCVLRDTKSSQAAWASSRAGRAPRPAPDGLCDIMVKADDAPKISRMIERFKFATVDRAQIESEIIADRDARAEDAIDTDAPEASAQAGMDVNETDALLDELLGPDEGAAQSEVQPEILPQDRAADIDSAPKPAETKEPPADRQEPAANPSPAKTDPPPPSAPTSGNKPKSERGTFSKPSVRGELREIAAGLRKRAIQETESPARDAAAEAPKPTTPPVHKQPQRRGKSKSKRKGAR